MEVVAIGEALIDILSHDCMHNKASNSELDFTQFAGGAPANVAVAVAKLGGSSYLLGKVGNYNFSLNLGLFYFKILRYIYCISFWFFKKREDGTRVRIVG